MYLKAPYSVFANIRVKTTWNKKRANDSANKIIYPE